MKRLTAITLFCLLFFSALVAGKGSPEAPISRLAAQRVALHRGHQTKRHPGDTARARELFREAILNDSTYAPAYYELAGSILESSPGEAVELARRAFRLDTANKWYHQFYGQALIMSNQLDEALKVYRPPVGKRPQGPGQLPHRGGPLRAETIALHGSRDARFGGAALRTHPAAERHETADAGGYEPDRQSRRRSPRNGRSRTL